MELIYILIIFMCAMIPLILTKHKVNAILNDFRDPVYQFLFILLMILIIYVYKYRQNNEQIMVAVKRGVVAFIIAYLAHIDLPFGVFILIFMISYYFDRDFNPRDNL